MFNDTPTSNEQGVNDAIDSLLAEMSGLNGDSEEYATMVTQLTKLYSLKEIDNKVKSWKRVSAETLVVVGGNVLGIAMIVSHERASVLTSKALSLLLRTR